jgi:hypothetical protein
MKLFFRTLFAHIPVGILIIFRYIHVVQSSTEIKKMAGYRIEKVISGGQTGVDQIGLKVANSLGIATGGTAPKGFRTEDGPNLALAEYGLVEDTTSKYPSRTKKNVLNSDGTVVFGELTSGTQKTVDFAILLGKPYLTNPTIDTLSSWLQENNIRILNVAGNRGSNMTSDQKEKIRTTLTLALQKVNHI